MPHQCTDCGRTFDDGSTEMLSGCPDCGGNKFQYQPKGRDEPPETDAEPPDPPEPSVDSSVARTVGNAATAVRDFVGSDSEPPEEPSSPRSSARPDHPAESADDPSPDTSPTREPTDTEPPATDRTESTTDTAEGVAPEDSAQASARSEIVSPDDLPSTASEPDQATGGADETNRSVQPSSPSAEPAQDDGRDDEADLQRLRKELNDQFESIKVLEPGQYELNLMELYDREEYIIALQEDGKYTIQVPERWKDD